jgi:CBS domain containing-hemolysin-like protein
MGIITAQLFFLHRESLHTVEDIIAILAKPFFIPESMSASICIRQMYHRKESLALVVDEYGSISGLITLEDLVETVIGEIADARDTKSHYTRSGQNILIASGKMELSEFDEIFGVTLHSENNRVTLGGWLTEQMGDIPKTGAKILSNGFFFHVLAADAKRIKMIYVRKVDSSQEES